MGDASGSHPVGRAGVTIPGAWSLDLRGPRGGAYLLFLWCPPGPAPEGGYPVAYLLDGNAVFGTAVDVARSRGAAGIALAAIGYADPEREATRRVLDLTPAALEGRPPPPPRPDGTPWPPSGGAGPFLDFLSDAVLPAVAAALPADPRRRALIGHSFGGLFALHCLFTRAEVFTTYVAASPSLWWDDGAVLATERAFATRTGALSGTRLLVTIGDGERTPPGPGPAGEAVARDLVARLDGTRGLSARFHLFPGEDHGSVLPASVARGLRFFGEGSR